MVYRNIKSDKNLNSLRNDSKYLIVIFLFLTQCFVLFIALFAAGNAEIASHSTIKHGHAPIHKAAPIHPVASYHAPVHKPVPVYHPAPVYKPAPVYHPAPSYKPAPVYKPAPSYKPTHQTSYHQPDYFTPPKYLYEYGVKDEYSGVDFGQNEARDGYSTYGEYRVALPDCRTQIVKYNTHDEYSGNIMEVVYEGYPCAAPVHKPVHKPAPVYKAAPIYKPAPVYHG